MAKYIRTVCLGNNVAIYKKAIIPKGKTKIEVECLNETCPLRQANNKTPCTGKITIQK